MSRSNSEPVFTERGCWNSVPQRPVQRKTAVLSTDHRQRGPRLPPHNTKAESKEAWTKVSEGHQRQKPAPELIRTEPEAEQNKHGTEQKKKVGVSLQTLKNCGSDLQQNPRTKQVDRLGRLWNPANTERSSGPKEEVTQVKTGSEGGPEPLLDSLEFSFQEKLRRWECDRQVESVELGEFELLEQAAEELSFSSTSSFVMKVLYSDLYFSSMQNSSFF